MIRKKWPIVVAVSVCLLLLAIVWLRDDKKPIKQPGYTISRVIQYSFDVQNTSNVVLNDVVFSAYAPVLHTATQKTVKLEASHPYELQIDALNNQVMHFKFDTIAPYETRVVRIRAALTLSEQPNRLETDIIAPFLQEETYIEIAEPALIELAKILAKQKTIDTARSIYDWVANNIQYSGYIKEDKGALYAFNTRQGDCTEYTYLYNALSRINGIPSRAMGGYVYADNATLAPKDYHNWTDVYLDGKWQIIDAQKKSFLDKSARYIAMRVITEESNSVLGNSHRFVYSHNAVKITMN